MTGDIIPLLPLEGQFSDPVCDPERLLVLNRKWVVAGAVVENGAAVDTKPNSYDIENSKMFQVL